MLHKIVGNNTQQQSDSTSYRGHIFDSAIFANDDPQLPPLLTSKHTRTQSVGKEFIRGIIWMGSHRSFPYCKKATQLTSIHEYLDLFICHSKACTGAKVGFLFQSPSVYVLGVIGVNVDEGVQLAFAGLAMISARLL